MSANDSISPLGLRRRLAARARSAAAWERLGPLDTEMLGHERLAPEISADCPWLLVYRGPCPSEEELRQHVAARLDGLPKLRRKLAFPPLGLSRPLWVEDDSFDLGRHVGVIDQPHHHGPAGWLRFIGEASAKPLDKSGPPWRLELAPGTGDGTFAVIFRHNHVLADGLSALTILRSLLADAPVDPTETRSRVANHASPRAGALLWRDAMALVGLIPRVGRWARAGGGRRGEVVRGARESGLALAELVRMLVCDPAPPRLAPLNQALGARRQAAEVTLPSKEVGTISEAVGCFPNEIYLATLAGGLRRFLRAEGVAIDSLSSVRAGVLVNVGGRRDPARLGNHISGLPVALPIAEPDPLRRLSAVRSSTKRIGTTRLVHGFEVLNSLQRLTPSCFIRHVARLSISPRATINLVASHMVPPRRLRSFAGRRLERISSWTFLPAGHTISFVCHSYGDFVTIGLLAEPDLVDAEALCEHLSAAHRELLEAARGVAGLRDRPLLGATETAVGARQGR